MAARRHVARGYSELVGHRLGIVVHAPGLLARLRSGSKRLLGKVALVLQQICHICGSAGVLNVYRLLGVIELFRQPLIKIVRRM